MKLFLLSLLVALQFVISLVGCSSKKANLKGAVKPQTSEYATEANTTSETSMSGTVRLKKLSKSEKLEHIQKHYNYFHDLKVIRCDVIDNAEFKGFDYGFMILDSSRFHHDYAEATRFEPEDIYETQLSRDEHSVSSEQVSAKLPEELSDLLTTWIPLKQYDGIKAVYSTNEFHGGYYVFSDSLIYDWSFMDGPYVYKYLDISIISGSYVAISILDLNSNKKKKLHIYFQKNGSILLKHEDKYTNGEPGYWIAIPHRDIYKYPIMVADASELPSGFDFDQIDFENLIQEYR